MLGIDEIRGSIVSAQTTQPLPSADNDAAIRHDWRKAEVQVLFDMPFMELLFLAAQTHRRYFDPSKIQISRLASIKTGSCPEDCHYCPQSAHYKTGLDKQKLMEIEEVVRHATEAKQDGASRFCMGAAWRGPNDADFEKTLVMIEKVKSLGLETCATFGLLKPEQAQRLKEAGLDYYNHNLDTSEAHYKNIISTRTYQDRLDTLEHVRNAGINVCCGGIIGLGEGEEDRAEMLRTLANLPTHPESVPINLLIPIKGTPLENAPRPDPIDFVKTIAVARLMMPASVIRLAAGREDMSPEMQALCFFAGVNSIFSGEKLLTARNASANSDQHLFAALSLSAMQVAEAHVN